VRRQRQIEERLVEPLGPGAMVELVTLVSSLDRLRLELDRAEGRLTALSIGTLLESEGMGLHFEIVEEPIVPTRAVTTWSDLVVLGVVTFLLGLPVCALAVGAFTRRIDEMEDVTLLGIVPLGRLRVPSGGSP
jgi:hypothetical protein